MKLAGGVCLQSVMFPRIDFVLVGESNYCCLARVEQGIYRIIQTLLIHRGLRGLEMLSSKLTLVLR
jgi:hypothetical protein